MVAALKRSFRRTRDAAKRAFGWHLERFRCDPATAQSFWDLMRDVLPPLQPDLPSLDSHFAALHSHPESCSSVLDPALAASLAAADIAPFTAQEVATALSAMQRGKSTGLASYPVDIFRTCRPELFELVAELFCTFAQHGYPSKLNTLLLLPLWKRKGSPGEPANHRGISLIHPLGRWFAKVVE